MPRLTPQPPSKADDPEQSKRFIDMAREVGADEDPEAMERAFRKVIRPPQAPPTSEADKKS